MMDVHIVRGLALDGISARITASAGGCAEMIAPSRYRTKFSGACGSISGHVSGHVPSMPTITDSGSSGERSWRPELGMSWLGPWTGFDWAAALSGASRRAADRDYWVEYPGGVRRWDGSSCSASRRSGADERNPAK